jgi:hypothetical protein
LSLPLFFYGELSLSMQAFVRISYALLLFATLLMTLGPSRWFFTSERYGGYAKSGFLADRMQNPAVLPWLFGLWFGCAVMMAAGFYTVWFSFINLLLCRYFFIQTRWKSILRGMGAPGFMTYWLGACVFFLEYGLHMDPGSSLRPLALSVFRIDFAAIMLSAGFYKLVSGYPRNQGMEYGMVNPWWGYWWRFYRKVPPDHIVFKVLNHLAYGTEIVAGFLLLIPSTWSPGAALVIVSFLFIATQIRLGFLCEMVMLAALIYTQPGSLADDAIRAWVLPSTVAVAPVSGFTPYVNSALGLFLWAYILMLPLAHAGLWYNFLGRKPLPGVLQQILDRYTNFFGIMIWRVFTIDVVNFFAHIYVIDKHNGQRIPYRRLGSLDWSSRFRFWHVGEFVCLASLFTTLKYYPSNRSLFEERLLRYARTVPCPSGCLVLFEYRSIRKLDDGFEFLPVVEYVVDPHQGTVEEKPLDERFSFQSDLSPVHEARSPGTYAPLEVADSVISHRSKLV